MKSFFNKSAALTAILSFALAACQPAATPAPASEAGSLRVVAAESFIADMAQNVAGDRARVDTLMPLGIDPHGFEPTPQDVAKIAESNVLIVNGAGFEEWLQEVLDNAGGERAVIEAATGLQSRSAREGEEAEMSPEEKAETFCSALTDAEVIEKSAEVDAAAAAAAHEAEHKAAEATAEAAGEPATEGEEAHDHEGEAGHDHAAETRLVQLTLPTEADGAFAGFFTIHPHEDGDYQVAAPAGALTLRSLDGSQTYEAEDTVAVDCNGLAQMLVYELEPGEYTLELSGMPAAQIPLALGPAAGHHHHEGDPHFWLDPLNVVKYVENIRDGLIQADPAGEAQYTANAASYIASLQQLDKDIQQQVSALPEEKRLIVTNHESFGYFADRYGFTIIGTIIPSVSTGSSPSAQQLARLVDRIRATGATAIFLETGANAQLAQQVSEETGVKVITDLYTHSITEAGGAAPTYIDMMKYNVKTIVEALK